jgi:dephospho-CoA kinase
MGTGKSTAREYLQQIGYEWVSFAQPLKDIAAELWGEEARTDRGRLQALGMAVRNIDPDAWVNLALRKVDEATQPVVIDDCRFPNEYWPLAERGFKFVKLYSTEPTRVARLMANGKLEDTSQLEHESEFAIDDLIVDAGIDNNAQVEDLQDAVAEIMRGFAL